VGGTIGPVICSTFAREGAAVAVAHVAPDRASATAARCATRGARAIGIGVDVSLAGDVAKALDEVTAQLGPVDVLVNAHGISPIVSSCKPTRTSGSAPSRSHGGTMLTCRAVGNQMVSAGSAARS